MTNLKRQGFYRLIPPVLNYGLAGLLIIAPFYAILAVWASTLVHHFDLLRILKELVLFILLAAAIVYLAKKRGALRQLLNDKLIIAIMAFAGFTLMMSVYALRAGVSREAVIYGDLIYFRLVGIFSLAYIIYKTVRSEQRLSIRQIIIWPSIAVVVFGLLQMFVLPADWLRHFGYSQSTIAAFQTVDNRPDFVRTQSTLRGPNPLGAYLVIVIILGLATYLQNRRPRYLWLVAGSLVVLYGTYSRSAWAGLAIAVAAWISIGTIKSWKQEAGKWRRQETGRTKQETHRRQKISVLAGLLVVLAITSGVLLVQHHNYVVQNVLLHTSNQSTSVISSNAQRNQAIKDGLNDVWHHPLGSGVGTAGPASLRNHSGQIKLSENFFIQVAQETGIIGLILFLIVLGLICLRLYQKANLFSQALLAILIGLTLINLLSHAWADDTLAYIWWGLAGIALGSGKIKTKN